MFWTASAGVTAIGRASRHTGSPVSPRESCGKRRSSGDIPLRVTTIARPAPRHRLDVAGGVRLGLGRPIRALRRGQRPPPTRTLVLYAPR